MKPENTIIIPKTEYRITGFYRIDRLIEYVRKNDYPHWIAQQIAFEVYGRYALCSELDTNEFSSVLDAVEAGIYDEPIDGERLKRFEGGWALIEPMCYNVYVDGHLYFFNF